MGHAEGRLSNIYYKCRKECFIVLLIGAFTFSFAFAPLSYGLIISLGLILVYYFLYGVFNSKMVYNTLGFNTEHRVPIIYILLLMAFSTLGFFLGRAIYCGECTIELFGKDNDILEFFG